MANETPLKLILAALSVWIFQKQAKKPFIG